jgi:D-glucosaminate-6-phosphate ammonia-lyase
MVDAASEFLRRPDPYLARGASLVVYSGGKYLRGPQSTGLLIGEAKWIAAAALNASPHTGMGRHLKVSKEEICGLVAAVELWATQRDLARELAWWRGELQVLAAAAEKCPGVRGEMIDWKGPEEPTPRLKLVWDRARVGIDGPTLRQRLVDGDPSVQVDDRFAVEDSITILPLNLQPGEALIVGQRIAAELGAAPARTGASATSTPSAVDLTGRWQVALDVAGGTVEQVFDLAQKDGAITGTHHLASLANPIVGTVDGERVLLQAQHPAEGGMLSYRFAGVLRDGRLSGTAELGTAAAGVPNLVNRREYGEVAWTARRA